MNLLDKTVKMFDDVNTNTAPILNIAIWRATCGEQIKRLRALAITYQNFILSDDAHFYWNAILFG